MNKLKVLFVTNSSPYGIYHMVDSVVNNKNIENEILYLYEKKEITFMNKVFTKLKLPLDYDNLNKRLLAKVSEYKPDIILIAKGNNIFPSTLNKLKYNYPNAKLISWSLDDMYAWHNRSFYYTLGLKYYDTVFTTKSYNIEELKSLGAKKVKFLYQAYSKIYHKSCNECNDIKDKADVLFIGFGEKERFESINYLAKHGIKVTIYGANWHKKEFNNYHNNIKINDYPLFGKDYSNTISCSFINLCFLRKINRDLHTSRSIEIPACGGFMLAERTQEHRELFEEDKEAVYFSSNEELLDKVKYYIKNTNERKNIAQSGYNRCINSNYSYDNMLDKILEGIKNV
ncbi:MAG: glycosyltransferase [Helicobacteraceae bacterium]|nr:glycosyltransferase [Helicobacteraceae bacterium]